MHGEYPRCVSTTVVEPHWSHIGLFFLLADGRTEGRTDDSRIRGCLCIYVANSVDGVGSADVDRVNLKMLSDVQILDFTPNG